MKLVRIGFRIFNMDKLVEAKVSSDVSEATLQFAAPEGSGADNESSISPYFARLYKREAQAFWNWAIYHSDEILYNANEDI